MAESTKEAMEEFEKEVKQNFDLTARLKNRGLRKGRVTLFLEEELGEKLGWAYDLKNDFQEVVRRERHGLVGEIDKLTMDRAELDKNYNAALSHKDITSAEKTKLNKGYNPLAEAIDAKLAELQPEHDELLAELTKTSLVVYLRAVPPIIEKDTRRKAKQTIGLTEKGVPKELEEEFLLAQSAHLITVMVTSIYDTQTDTTNTAATYDDALALMDYLPPSQYTRLDEKMGELQYTDAISRQIENQEDFS